MKADVTSWCSASVKCPSKSPERARVTRAGWSLCWVLRLWGLGGQGGHCAAHPQEAPSCISFSGLVCHALLSVLGLVFPFYSSQGGLAN